MMKRDLTITAVSLGDPAVLLAGPTSGAVFLT